MTVSQDTALNLSAMYTCVSLIADAVAALPVDVVRTVGKVREPVPGPAWLSQPNPFDTAFDFWHKVMTSLLTDGNAIIRVSSGGDAMVSPRTRLGLSQAVWRLG